MHSGHKGRNAVSLSQGCERQRPLIVFPLGSGKIIKLGNAMRIVLSALLFLNLAAFAGGSKFDNLSPGEEMDGRGIWVHPEIRQAIQATEIRLKKDNGGLRTGEEPETAAESIVVNGKKQFIGYHPTWEQYDGARFKNFNRYTGKNAEAEIPDEFDYRTLGVSPVRRQLCGDCWAQGNVSAMEFIVNAADKVSRIFSVQDVIDNSGIGSCGGGQLSMAHDEKGMAYESEYLYTGRTGRPSSPKRHEAALETGYLRGTDGKFPTLQDIQQAVIETGAMEVCGSASALGNGGRQDTIRSGSTNHCYALVGWFNGKKKFGGDWLDAVYLIIKNSWGDGSNSKLSPDNGQGWGDAGYGYYPLAKGDGKSLKGSVITEIQWARYKPLTPPEPIVNLVKIGKVNFKITALPSAMPSLVKQITMAVSKVEAQ